MRAEYVEAFFRYFAEATLDDSKAVGVRALIPDFRRPRARAPGAAAGRGRRLGVVEAINEQLRLLKIHLPYHESDHVRNLAYNVLTGGARLEDIKRLRRDVAYMNALGADLVPDPTTAGDFCRRFTRGRRGGVDGRGQLGAREAVARPGRDCSTPWSTSTWTGRSCPRRGHTSKAACVAEPRSRRRRCSHSVSISRRPIWTTCTADSKTPASRPSCPASVGSVGCRSATSKRLPIRLVRPSADLPSPKARVMTMTGRQSIFRDVDAA